MSGNGKTTLAAEQVIANLARDPSKADFTEGILKLVPFTGVPFTGKDALYSIGRIAGYSFLAYLTYNKVRPASYIFMGAVSVSFLTSLMTSIIEIKKGDVYSKMAKAV